MSVFTPAASPILGFEPAWEIALLFPAQGKWSVWEYLDLTDETRHLVEYTRGRIEVLAMPTTGHLRILDFLYSALKDFIRAHYAGP